VWQEAGVKNATGEIQCGTYVRNRRSNRMNVKDRSTIERIKNLLDEGRAMLEELRDSHQERLDNMSNGFEGTPRYETMESQQGTLEQLHDDLENLLAEFDEIEEV
jgi:hypothetical protein